MINRNNSGQPRGLRSALLAGAAVAICAGAAAAAEPSPVETVVVTGSRIATSDATAKAPLTIVSSAQISETRTVTLEQIFTKLPEFGQQGANDQNSINPGGLSTVDLRALGPNRTLVLVNGKRLVNTFANGIQGADLANIPIAMIDHVEILRDSASPVYGADAIAGVVNIITRQNFDGFQIDGMAGISGEGDRSTWDLSSVFGAQGSRGSFTAAIEYNHESPVRQGDRDWASGDPNTSSSNTASSAIPLGRFTDTVTGTQYYGVTGGGLLACGGPCTVFNTGIEPDLIQGRTRFNADLNAQYHLTSDITGFADFYFTNRKSDEKLNPMPIGDIYTTGKWPAGLIIPASNPNNPTGHDLGVRKRLFEIGDRFYNDNINTYQGRFGIKGHVFGDFSWELGYLFGESDGNNYTRNAPNLTHLQELVGNAPCGVGAPANCGQVTLMGLNSLTPDDIAYVRYTANRSSRYQEQVGYLDVTGDTGIGLGGGNVGVAFGAEWRREHILDIPDAIVAGGDSAEGDASVTQGSYNVKELYAETNLPFVKDRDWAEDLSVDLAARYSDYSNFGSTATYKAGANWQPNDSLRFRADYGTGFRAPQVGGELFLGSSQTFLDFNDPCVAPTNATVIANCGSGDPRAVGGTYNPATFTQDIPQLSGTIQGNANLKPEKSRQWNLGVVLTPDFLENFTATIDYYNVNLRDVIISPSNNPQPILNACFASAGFSSPLCSLIGPRDPIGHQLLHFNGTYINVGSIKTDGIDFSANYQFDSDSVGLGDIGTIELAGKATWLHKFDQTQPDGSVTHYAGIWYGNSISYAVPHWKANVSATLDSPDGFTFTATERYVEGTTDGLGTGKGDVVADVYYTDVVASYDWSDQTRVTLGVDNVFDKQPPYVFDTFQNAISNQYDFVGRFFYLKATQKFD